VLILTGPGGDLDAVHAILQRKLGPESVERFRRPVAFAERLSSGAPFDLLFVDVESRAGHQRPLRSLRRLRLLAPQVPIVAVVPQGSVGIAAEAIAAGASDILVASEQLEERVETLLGKVRHVLELVAQNRLLGERNSELQEAQRRRLRILGESPQIRAVLSVVERVARIPRPVLIVGERGTGKELVARAIHDAAGHGVADPGARPFVAVNCAAFADTLLESELFGHERGAFTGADRMTRGKFEQAAGGTLFLDEIANMSPQFQRKILRVVEYGRFMRVGGREEITVQARIVAATNAELETRIQAGEFLADLYDRLTFEIVRVPPLRERTGDIALLAQHFLTQFMAEIPSLGGKRLASSAIAALERYPFPGNVRELKNIVERAAYRDTTNEITPEDIGLLPSVLTPDATHLGFHDQIRALEATLLAGALDAAGGNHAAAARRLSLTYDQFRHYARKHHLG
jgi:DNA-binding NtrC family response regulator